MKINRTCGAVLCCLVPWMAQAQDWASHSETPLQKLQTSFGAAGLLSEWGSIETYGTIKARTTLQYAQESKAGSSGITSGYRDNTRSAVAPVSVMYSLPGTASFLNFTMSAMAARGSPNLTYSGVNIENAQLLFVHMASEKLLWSVGLFTETGDTDLLFNGTDIKNQATGLRADLLYRFSSHWGISLRLMQLHGDAQTTVPITGAPDMHVTQDLDRTYTQSTLIGTFRHADFSFIPDTWVMHPKIGLDWLHSNRKASTTSYGTTVAAESDDYGLISATVSFEKMAFRPGQLAPSFEVGLEHELHNSLGSYTDEPNYLYSKMALGIALTDKSWLSIAYKREDGLYGHRRAQAATLLYTVSF